MPTTTGGTSTTTPKAAGAVVQCALELESAVPETTPAVLAGPVRVQVPEEAALRVRLDAEHVPVAVAQRRDVVCRPARAPGIPGVPPSVVDEPEHDLLVLDELPEDVLLTRSREQELALGVGGDHLQDAAAGDLRNKRTPAAVLLPEEARPALVVAGVVDREDGLRGLRHRSPEGGEEPRLDEDLESVADAEHGLPRLDELREVLRELPL